MFRPSAQTDEQQNANMLYERLNELCLEHEACGITKEDRSKYFVIGACGRHILAGIASNGYNIEGKIIYGDVNIRAAWLCDGDATSVLITERKIPANISAWNIIIAIK